MLLFGGGREVYDGHLAAQAPQEIRAGIDDAAGGIQNKLARGALLHASEDLVKRGDFRGEILGFALRVRGAVWPAHPGSDAGDAGVATGFQPGAQALLNAIVARDGGASGLG